MATAASQFIKNLVSSGMEKNEALELLQRMSAKHAKKYKASSKGAATTNNMHAEAKEFVDKCMADDDMSEKDAIELLRSIDPKYANLYEGARKTYATGKKPRSINFSGKQSVTNEDLINQIMCLTRRSPELLQQLKTITEQRAGNAGVSKFRRIVKVNLPKVTFGVSRWADKADGVPGVKSLLSEAIATEEGSKPSAVEPEVTAPILQANTTQAVSVSIHILI